ncbi:MAG: chemotaxis-specific methylesterase [Methanoregulaceae archaeon PtaB.Bin009]|nr:MAG: chemotaxis-specific methylesterase [Methanoregulaceae archaeon PtaB.Bin009]
MIRLLHVDDDTTVLELGKLYLEKSGELVVDTARSGYVAKTMLLTHTYDAIISDYNMPECNGIEFLRHVRKTDQRTPFLFFSDHGEEDVIIDALTSGADFFLPKGISVRSQFIQLEHAIRESVMRRRAEREQRKISSVLRTREAAVRSTLCPLALCDTDGRIQYANPAGLAAWGYADESEVVGRHVSDFVVSPGVSPEDILDLIEQKTWIGQATALRKDGTTFDARVSVSTMTDEEGDPVGFIASFTDLSRQRRVRMELESYVGDIRFVSEKSSEFADLPPDDDAFLFIADIVSTLSPEGAVVLISSMHNDRIVRVEAVRGPSQVLAAIEGIFGRPVVGIELRPAGEDFSAMLPKAFIEIDGGIDAITFGQLPPGILEKIDELPFGKVIGTGLSWGGKVNGITVIILPAGVSPGNLDVLDLFVRHCSAVLHRRQLEKLLKGTANLPAK